MIESDTKNHRVRFVPLTEQVAAMLEEVRAGKEDGYIFADGKGRPLHPDTFSKRFRKVRDGLGLDEGIHLHCCRHPYVKTATKIIFLERAAL